MTVREAMIVAGGQGTRLMPLTLKTPKPLLPLVGLPFLSGVIRRLAAVGVERVLLVVGEDPSPFEVLAEDAAAFGVQIEMVPEPTPLDTAGGVRSALDRVSGTFLVLNGDVLTGLDLDSLIAAHATTGATATLALTRVEDTSAFGVCVLEGDRIVDFVEKPAPGSLPGQDAVNAGTYVLEPAALERFDSGRLSFERDVFPGLVRDGSRVTGVVSAAVWADLGTPERYLRGHRLVLDGALEWPTMPRRAVSADDQVAEAGEVYLAEDAEVAPSAVVRGPSWLGPGSSIAAGADVGPYVVLGPGVTVGAGSRIADSVVLADSHLGDRVQLARAIVGARTQLGNDVRVDRLSVIGDDQRVPSGTQIAAGCRWPE